MCVIIHKPAGISFKEEDLRCAHANNSHGFGYMYYDPESQRVKAAKAINLTPDRIVEIVNGLKDFNACFHYRFKTHGEISDAQCHPFRVLDKEKHGVDMFLMHNGVISKSGLKDGESDTQAFNKNFLKPILKKAPELIKTDAFKILIEDYIGKGSKLCFMFGDGKVIKFNEAQGDTHNECWVSNTYSFKQGHREPKYNGYANKAYDDFEYEGYYSGYGYTNKKNAATTPKEEKESATQKFLGVDVKEKDVVYIWNHEDEEFFAEGTIEELNFSTAFVKFKTTKGATERLAFYLDDGNSLVNRGTYYYAIPAAEWEDRIENSISVENEKKRKGAKVQMTNVTETNKVGSGGTPTSNEGEALECIVTHNDMSVDAADHYGGAFIDGSDIGYNVDGENVTFRDVAEMTYQERFEFFCDHFDVAFNMFQDLVENICIQDVEYMEEYLDEIAQYDTEDEFDDLDYDQDILQRSIAS
jgi:hypothetical protein